VSSRIPGITRLPPSSHRRNYRDREKKKQQQEKKKEEGKRREIILAGRRCEAGDWRESEDAMKIKSGNRNVQKVGKKKKSRETRGVSDSCIVEGWVQVPKLNDHFQSGRGGMPGLQKRGGHHRKGTPIIKRRIDTQNLNG